MMIFLIPSAKEMNVDTPTYPQPLSPESQTLVNHIALLSPKELATAYKIKIPAAEIEYQRWQDLKNGQAKTYPAAYLFNGLMYRHLRQKPFTSAEEDYLAKQTFITSSLYGVAPLFAPMAPHRLDFNNKFSIDGQSLKNYWRPAYDHFAQMTSQPIISLLSSEFEDIFSPKVRESFYQLKFMEEKDGQLKTHSTISKKARGQLLYQAAHKNCQTIDDLKSLTFDHFGYQSDLSTERHLVFIKHQSP